jgi:hypothetical protein
MRKLVRSKAFMVRDGLYAPANIGGSFSFPRVPSDTHMYASRFKNALARSGKK